MIPKIIHYCWFGGAPLPALAERCIASWKEHMPEWEYKCWNEATLSQALYQPNPNPFPKGKGAESAHMPSAERGEGCWLEHMPVYVRQAYEARKFAFVSDYVRLWALEQYGGVYLDTDVMVLRSYESLLNDTAFIGLEESKAHLPGTCVMGCEQHSRWASDMLALYDGVKFFKPDGSFDLTTNVERMGFVMITELKNEGINEKEYWKSLQYISKWGLRIYTHDYFSPITSTRVMRKTTNTYSIHYYAGSWIDGKKKPSWRDWLITHEIINALVQIKRMVLNLNTNPK